MLILDPPPLYLVRLKRIAAMRGAAEPLSVLQRPRAGARIDGSPLKPIYDLASGAAFGRVVLIGDARLLSRRPTSPPACRRRPRMRWRWPQRWK